MALISEQSNELQAAMTKLRDMGCAVCIFMPEDVESAAENDERQMSPETAATWLLVNRKRLEDGMATWGNQYISDNLPLSTT